MRKENCASMRLVFPDMKTSGQRERRRIPDTRSLNMI
jgi:hypothetical protein